MHFKGKNLRKGRCSEPGRAYLVTTVTFQRKQLFENFRFARIVTDAMRFRHEKGVVESMAFVVMPDHLHWLLTLCEGQDLSRMMQSFKAFTARRIKQEIPEYGMPIWQAGYHDHAVRSDEDIKALARYVIANPLRAGIVKNIGDYPLWDAIWL